VAGNNESPARREHNEVFARRQPARLRVLYCALAAEAASYPSTSGRNWSRSFAPISRRVAVETRRPVVARCLRISAGKEATLMALRFYVEDYFRCDMRLLLFSR